MFYIFISPPCYLADKFWFMQHKQIKDGRFSQSKCRYVLLFFFSIHQINQLHRNINFFFTTACMVFKFMQISGLWISLYSWGAYRIHIPALCRWLNVYWHNHCLIMLVFYAYVKVECICTCIYVRKIKRMNFNPFTVYVFSNCIDF